MNQCVVILTDRRVIPPWSGNRMRILGMIQLFRALGWRVAVVIAERAGAEQLKTKVNDLFLVQAQAFLGGDLRTFDVEPFRRILEQVVATVRPRLIISEYAWMAPAMVSLDGDVCRWIDCHDILHERTARFQALNLDPWVICTKDQELELLSCADVLLAIQHREASLLKQLLPNKKIVCLLPHIELPHDFRRTSVETAVVLTVGTNHAGNEGIRRFVNEWWPSVVDRVPESYLHVIGGIGTGLISPPTVRIVVDAVDVYHYYRSAAVVVCPIIVGTGIKIKMLEALRFGRAVVATEAAAEGLLAPKHRAWLAVKSLTECADAVATLLVDRETRIQLETAAFAYGRQHLSKQRALAKLRSILP